MDKPAILKLERPGVPGVLKIGETEYAYRTLPKGAGGEQAVRLFKPAGKPGPRGGKPSPEATYTVAMLSTGFLDCDCPSHVMTTPKTNEPCKHCRALYDLGLLTDPVYCPEEESIPF